MSWRRCSSQGKAALGAVIEFHGFDATEFEHGLAAGFDGCEAGADIFFGLKSDVLIDFFTQALFLLAARGGIEKTSEEALEGFHGRSSALTSKKRPMMAAVWFQSLVSAWRALRPSLVRL